jgi:hypothetical protein
MLTEEHKIIQLTNQYREAQSEYRRAMKTMQEAGQVIAGAKKEAAYNKSRMEEISKLIFIEIQGEEKE